jgi:hypothetical protein
MSAVTCGVNSCVATCGSVSTSRYERFTFWSGVCGGCAPSLSKFGSALSKTWNFGSVAGSVSTHTVSMRIVSTDIVVTPRDL